MPFRQKITTVIWNIQYYTPPSVLRYCKKCGKKSEYICSEEFRVNANKKALDIWLVYKCARCNTTWNSTICSRISPRKLGPDLLERFYNNDRDLYMRFAMDISLLQKNGAQIKLPDFEIVGENISFEHTARVKIRSQYVLPIKLSAVLRAKLGVSQSQFEALLSNNQIQSETNHDIRKCKISSSETVLMISK